MEISLLLRVNKRPSVTNGKIAELTLDATISETHNYISRVTQFPIEDGSTISDNIINDPVQLTMTGFVTNNPLLDAKELSKYSLDDLPPPLYRAQAAFSDLLEIRKAREPIVIVTSLKMYAYMVMTSLNVQRDGNSGDALEFTAEFTQITIVSSKKVKLEQVKPVVKHTVSKTYAEQIPVLTAKNVEMNLFTFVAVPDHTSVASTPRIR